MYAPETLCYSNLSGGLKEGKDEMGSFFFDPQQLLTALARLIL